MNYEITPCTEKDGEFIDDMIGDFNLAQCPPDGDPKRAIGWFGRKMTDEDGKIIAGCTAIRTVWGTSELDFLWVDESYRRQGLGSRLLREVEQVLQESGCTIVQLDTFDWQARGFYEKNGYSVFGTLEDCPPGHCRYYMKKSL